jgi:hypothetical protein
MKNRCPNCGHKIRGARDYTYISWISMIGRCTKKEHKSYKFYGGRGITICQAWFDFKNFLADMGLRPEGLQLDRVDTNGNYERSNCRWATREQNNLNRRAHGSSNIDWNGSKWSVYGLARAYGMSRDTLRARLNHKWPIDKALLTPVANG